MNLFYSTKKFKVVLKRFWHSFLKNLQVTERSGLASVVKELFTIIPFFYKVQKLPLPIRQVLSLVQPRDPLSLEEPAIIDVVIPCHPKDFARLPLVLDGVRQTVKNPIHSIRLITPNNSKTELQFRFPNVKVIADETLLSKELFIVVQNSYPASRHSWIRQQLLKFMAVLSSEAVGSLVVDSDTVLLSPRTWLDTAGRQCLDIAFEYHLPYMTHLRDFLQISNFPASFVTHHQLMQRRILQEIFGFDGKGLSDWIKSGDPSEASPISDYETYGQFLVTKHHSLVKFSKWNNTSSIFNSKTDPDYTTIKRHYKNFSSVSFHSYL